MGRPAGAALAAAILVLGVGAVIAQSDPIATRMALIKENNENAKLVVERDDAGAGALDAAKVDAAFVHWADTAQKLPSLFPDNSKERPEDPRRTEDLDSESRLRCQGSHIGNSSLKTVTRPKARSTACVQPFLRSRMSRLNKDYRLTRQ